MCVPVPEYMLYSFRDLTPAFLTSLGIRAMLLDIDNTLSPYETAEPTEETLAWIRSMQSAGIRLAFVTNNDASRAEIFNRSIGIPIYAKCKKPLTGKLRAALADLGVTARETAMLGDQLLTDAWAGKRLGAVTVIVPPIKDKLTLFFRTKRLLEKSANRRYMRLHPEFHYPDIYSDTWRSGSDPRLARKE